MLIRPLYLNNGLLSVCDESDVLNCHIDWANIINKPPNTLQEFNTPPIICDNSKYTYPTTPRTTGTIVFDKFRLIQRYIDPTSSVTVADTSFVFDSVDHGNLLQSNWYALFLVHDSSNILARLTTLVRVNSSQISNGHTIITLGNHLHPSNAITASDIGWTTDIYSQTNSLAIVLSGSSIYKTSTIISNSTSGNAQITIDQELSVNQGDWLCISPMGYTEYTLVGSTLYEDTKFLPFLQSYHTVIYLDEILLWRGRTANYIEIDTNLISPLATYILDISGISNEQTWEVSFSLNGSDQIRYIRNYRSESDGLAFLPLTENKSIFVKTRNRIVDMYIGGFAY